MFGINKPLADQFAEAKREYDIAKRKYNQLRDEVLATGETSLEGKQVMVLVKPAKISSIDREGLKIFLTPGQIESVTTRGVTSRLIVHNI